MPPDLLAHHVVPVGGAFLHPRHRAAGVFACAVIGVRCLGFRLLVETFGLIAGLFGSLVHGFAALSECLEARIRHFSSPESSFPNETRRSRKGCIAFGAVLRPTHAEVPPFRPSRCYVRARVIRRGDLEWLGFSLSCSPRWPCWRPCRQTRTRMSGSR